jgi:hypothetical protein
LTSCCHAAAARGTIVRDPGWHAGCLFGWEGEV